MNKLQIKQADLIPTLEDLQKLKVLSQNQEGLVEIIDDDTDEFNLAYSEFIENCESLEMDGEYLMDVLLLSKAFEWIKDNSVVLENAEVVEDKLID